MADNTKVSLDKGGTEIRTVPICKVAIPDLWPIAQAIHETGKVADGQGCAKLILECWSLAHDLKRHIQEA